MSTVLEKSFEIITPVDGSVYAAFDYATANAIDDVFTLASKSIDDWSECGLSKRIEIVSHFLQIFEANKKQIAHEIAWQMGRPVHQAYGEVNGVIERTKYMMSCAEDALADVTLPEKEGFLRYIRKFPLGTLFIIAPWNYPYLTAINTIIPALLAGNTVILKHAKQTAKCAERLALCFKEAGMPEGVFNVLHLTHEDTEKLLQHPFINGVAFTGSVAVGRHLQKKLANRFVPIGLELGGKDAAYVREDAEVEKAISQLVDGAMFNSGQSCCGIERIYVHKNHYESFVEGFISQVNEYVLDNPMQDLTTLGPVATAHAAQQIRQTIKQAVSQGACALIDPNNFAKDNGNDAYLMPQVLVNVNHTMMFMTEEHFGPAVGIMPVENDVQAIDLMNDSPYGLTGSVWTQDLDAANTIGNQVNVGTWFMNRCDYLDPALPWIGIKNSGRGLTLSAFGYDQVTQRKSFHLKKFI